MAVSVLETESEAEKIYFTGYETPALQLVSLTDCIYRLQISQITFVMHVTLGSQSDQTTREA